MYSQPLLEIEAGIAPRPEQATPSWTDLADSVGALYVRWVVTSRHFEYFHCIYGFIEQHLDEPVPLWPSARKEMETFLGLMFVLTSSWRAPWSELVLASDASEFAYGVVGTIWEQERVADHGRLSERRRFNKVSASRARSHFESQHGYDLISSCFVQPALSPDVDGWELAKDFEEIGVDECLSSEWSVLVRQPWQKTADILLLEARALLRSLEVHVSLRPGISSRILLLCDSMSATLAFARRRAKSFKLLSTIRRFSALSLVLDLYPSVRWIPSEVNAADAPSRLRELIHDLSALVFKRRVETCSGHDQSHRWEERPFHLPQQPVRHDPCYVATFGSKDRRGFPWVQNGPDALPAVRHLMPRPRRLLLVARCL